VYHDISHHAFSRINLLQKMVMQRAVKQHQIFLVTMLTLLRKNRLLTLRRRLRHNWKLQHCSIFTLDVVPCQLGFAWVLHCLA
jgi:hypothetical protein